MKLHFSLYPKGIIQRVVGTITVLCIFIQANAQVPANNTCATAVVLTSSTACNTTHGDLANATSTGLASSCGTATSQDVWYSFVAKSPYPIITVSNLGSSWSTRLRIQLFSGTCASLTELGCASNAPLDTRVTPGGAGLTIGTTYYIRIHKNNATAPSGSGWGFDICVTDPIGAFDFGKSYINISKGTVGGTVTTGDTLEIRATFVARNITATSAADSLAFFDTLLNNKGYKLLAGAGTIALKTNEGKDYKLFTNAADADAGSGVPIGATLDTAIRINFGAGASNVKRGRLRNTSKPTVFGSTCIIMATYRVQVYAPSGTKIKWGGGRISYYDSSSASLKSADFKPDSLIVYTSPGLCPNAVSVTNAIGAESNGTFGTPAVAAPLARNRGVSAFVPGYVYAIFGRGTGPGDYFYGITNNTSAEFGLVNTRPKPDVDPDGSGGPMSTYRVFNVWDITGDHTGASNPNKGNPPCDTTKPVSATNPCGYMLVVNSAYKTDTAFQYTVTGLCPNTYYEMSAWVKNICSKCACDSNGVTPGNTGYIPTAPNDSSGVYPNLAFAINGIDYYTTGNVLNLGARAGVTTTGSDSVNFWQKKGFVYKTDTTQTGFTLTIRNNAPGGGGNDWALDDISLATCLPNMKYSPTINPTVCDSNAITIRDTVRSYFNNYTYYQWQRSTDGGATWSDIPGASGVGVPVWNGSAWQYVASYTIPNTATYAINNGDKYRLIVATTASNLSSAGCQVTDGVSIVTLTVLPCLPVLAVDMLSFNGRLSGNLAKLSWSMSREDEPLIYTIERSTDGTNFTKAGTVLSNTPTSELNNYNFTDPVPVTGKTWYRLVITNLGNKKKISRVIQLSTSVNGFELTTVVNPFNNQLDFSVQSSETAHFTAELIDMFGQKVRSLNYLAYPGVNSMSILNTSSLPTGVYSLRIAYNGMLITKQVIKTK